MLNPDRVIETDPAARLRRAGLRVTQPRLLVMRAMDSLPPDDEERLQHLLYRLLEQQGRALPLSTIYRVLRDLAAAGLMPAAQAGSEPVFSRSGVHAAAPALTDVPDPDHAD